MKIRKSYVALAFLLGMLLATAFPVFPADAPAKAPAVDPNAPISIETLANSRAVITDRIQQMQTAITQLEANKKQLDAEIDRRVAADKAKAKK